MEKKEEKKQRALCGWIWIAFQTVSVDQKRSKSRDQIRAINLDTKIGSYLFGYCHSAASDVLSWLKIDSYSCVYWLNVHSDHGQITSHRICCAMSASYKGNRQCPCWQESNGTFVLSTEKSNSHFANSVGLWPMSDVDIYIPAHIHTHTLFVSIQLWHKCVLSKSILRSKLGQKQIPLGIVIIVCLTVKHISVDVWP